MRHRTCFWVGLAVLVGLWLGLAVMLLHQAPRMAPVKPGTVDEFWEQACGVALDPTSNRPAYSWALTCDPVRVAAAGKGVYRSRFFVYGPFDGWYIYERPGFHLSDLFRVSQTEVRDSFERVLVLLDVRANREVLHPGVRRAVETWDTVPPGENRTVDRFLELIYKERRDEYLSWDKGLYKYFGEMPAHIEVRWNWSKGYGNTIAFEAVYFSLLILFLCWPVIRDKGRTAWAIHLGLTPFLFMLPAYLGYANLSFSSAGPSGGVAYPWLLQGVPGPMLESLDAKLFRALPKPLVSLSQPTGSALSRSWGGMPGPATALLIGVFLAALPFLFNRKLWKPPAQRVQKNKSDTEQDSR